VLVRLTAGAKDRRGPEGEPVIPQGVYPRAALVRFFNENSVKLSRNSKSVQNGRNLTHVLLVNKGDAYPPSLNGQEFENNPLETH
jgi:hypothetical protein